MPFQADRSDPIPSIKELMDHPVVHVAYEDAEAYALWQANNFPPRPSGNTPRAVDSTARFLPGATR